MLVYFACVQSGLLLTGQVIQVSQVGGDDPSLPLFSPSDCSSVQLDLDMEECSLELLTLLVAAAVTTCENPAVLTDPPSLQQDAARTCCTDYMQPGYGLTAQLHAQCDCTRACVYCVQALHARGATFHSKVVLASLRLPAQVNTAKLSGMCICANHMCS